MVDSLVIQLVDFIFQTHFFISCIVLEISSGHKKDVEVLSTYMYVHMYIPLRYLPKL